MNNDTNSRTAVASDVLLAEVRSYIAFGLRQRNAAKTGGSEAKVMYWTGYVFAMRTVESSIEREAKSATQRREAFCCCAAELTEAANPDPVCADCGADLPDDGYCGCKEEGEG
jgi:hypothetical protein